MERRIRTPKNGPLWLAASSMLLIGGCGFHPLYTRQNEGNVELLARIHINPIGNRVGHILRHTLIERMTPHGMPEVPHYALSVTLDVSTEPIHTAARGAHPHLIMSATYSLKDLHQNKHPVLFTSTGRTVTNYHRQDSPYATVFAERAAQSQAASHLADEIVERIALYFSSVRALTLPQSENTK